MLLLLGAFVFWLLIYGRLGDYARFVSTPGSYQGPALPLGGGVDPGLRDQTAGLAGAIANWLGRFGSNTPPAAPVPPVNPQSQPLTPAQPGIPSQAIP